MKRSTGLLLGLLAACAVVDRPAQAEVILHAFGWSYQEIARRADAIAKAGYKAVLVSAPLKSPKHRDCPWYLRYQPQDWRVIDNCDGNKQSLIQAIRALQAKGVRTYADLVVNQMANERLNATTFPGDTTLNDYARNRRSWRQQILYGDANGDGILDNGILVNHNQPAGLFGPQDFHPERCIQNYNDKQSVLRDRICGPAPDRGLPDLKDTDPTQNWVNQQRQHYIQALYDLGLRGFRIDAAKHMPIGAINTFMPNSVRRDAHIFAEIITWGGATDQEYQLYLEPYLRELPAEFGAYDFPLLNALKRAFAFDGRLADLAFPYATGNALENRRAITVAVTHDIPYNHSFRSLILEPKDEELAYAYILGRDGGSPLIFDDGTPRPSDGGRWANVWKRARMKAMLLFHNRLHGQPMDVLASDACALLWRRGKDGIVALNKCNQDVSFTVDTRFRFQWNHRYKDVLSNKLLPPIQGPNYTFTIPARSAQMWLAP
jgi:alpha-amylase